MNIYNEYEKTIPFNGSIVITDPCYLMRDADESLCVSKIPNIPYPNELDYFSQGEDESKYSDYKEQTIKLTRTKSDIYKAFVYAGCGLIDVFDYFNLKEGVIDSFTFSAKMSQIYWSEKEKHRKDCDKYYSYPHNDWEYCKYGKHMDYLGFTNSIVSDTLYGDWNCSVYEINDKNSTLFPNQIKKEIGSFCADAGLVGVFLVSELAQYNPKAIENLKHRPWCATFLDNFNGEITFKKVRVPIMDGYGKQESIEELRLIGVGNINFVTTQVGF